MAYVAPAGKIIVEYTGGLTIRDKWQRIFYSVNIDSTLRKERTFYEYHNSRLPVNGRFTENVTNPKLTYRGCSWIARGT